MERTYASVVFAAVLSLAMGAHAKPLKVYILAGQSNMQGAAKAGTIPYMAKDAETKQLHDKIVDKNGRPHVYKDVSVAAFSTKEKAGPLTVGFGSGLQSDDVLGPELAFGITVYEKLKEPVLIIKTAWGGKDLYCDFRPPSAGKPTYTIPAKKGQPRDIGAYYRLMSKHVKTVLGDPKKFCSAYDANDGYEIAGFVWFQGWNDMCAGGEIYPKSKKKDRYAEYSRLLACFIRDVRKDFRAPDMPFVIGVMGVDGIGAKGRDPFRKAMAAPAALPEFKGNVVAVETAKYWDKKLDELGKAIHSKPKKISYYIRKGGVPGKVVANGFPIAYKLRTSYWDTPPADRKAITKQETKAYLAEYRKTLYTAEDEALFKLGASNAAYHYLGSAKIYSLIGEAFAKALIPRQ